MNNTGVRNSKSQKQRLFYRTAGTSGFGLSTNPHVDLIIDYRPRIDPPRSRRLPEIRRATSIGASSLLIVEHSPQFNLQSETSGQSLPRNSRDVAGSEDAIESLRIARSSSQTSLLPAVNIHTRKLTVEPSPFINTDSQRGVQTDRLEGFSYRMHETDRVQEPTQTTFRPGNSLVMTAREFRRSQLKQTDVTNEATLSRGMNTNSVLNATTSRTTKQVNKREVIGESYSHVKLKNVRDNDIFLLTQARQEKAKRAQPANQRLAAWINKRINRTKFDIIEDGILEKLNIVDVTLIKLLVSNEAQCEFLCLEKTVATAKVIENFVILYHLRQECSTVQSNAENHYKLIPRLKSFLTRSTQGAFEIKMDSEESLKLFRGLEESKRPFLDADEFFATTSIEAIVLSYLFLEYKATFERSAFKIIASQLSLNIDDEETDPQDLEKVNRSPEDLRTAEQKALDELAARNQELNQKIAKMRAELLQARNEENGELSYNSKYLKMIEMCLGSKDILFDMNQNTFDTMIEMKRPYVERALYSHNGMSVPAKNLFIELMSLRQTFGEENRTLGNKLRNELELDLDEFYKAERYQTQKNNSSEEQNEENDSQYDNQDVDPQNDF